VDEEEQKRVEEAVEFAEKSPFPDPEEALRHLFYEERPPLQKEVLQ
jgi:TPP-dependent pyruvate/acetoin dehydrogenase alpha subunit